MEQIGITNTNTVVEDPKVLDEQGPECLAVVPKLLFLDNRVVIDAIGKMVFRVVHIVLYAAPIGAFGGMAYTVGRFDIGVLGNLATLMAAFYITCLLLILVVLGGVAAGSGGDPLRARLGPAGHRRGRTSSSRHDRLPVRSPRPRSGWSSAWAGACAKRACACAACRPRGGRRSRRAAWASRSSRSARPGGWT